MGFDEQVNSLKDPAGFKFTTIGSLVSTILIYSFTLAGLGLLVYFIWGGFQLFTSGGDQKKVAEGKTIITNALVGFVIVFVAFWIVQLVASLLGIPGILGVDPSPGFGR